MLSPFGTFLRIVALETRRHGAGGRLHQTVEADFHHRVAVQRIADRLAHARVVQRRDLRREADIGDLSGALLARIDLEVLVLGEVSNVLQRRLGEGHLTGAQRRHACRPFGNDAEDKPIGVGRAGIADQRVVVPVVRIAFEDELVVAIPGDEPPRAGADRPDIGAVHGARAHHQRLADWPGNPAAANTARSA